MLNDDFALPRPAALAGLLQALGNGALVRVTLLINHVIAAEPAAMRRLAGQAGKRVRVQWRGWPGFVPAALATRLPPPQPATWQISAAGLLDFEAALADAGGLASEFAGLQASVVSEGATAAAAAAAAADSNDALVVTLDAGDIGRWVLAAAGGRPPMEIQGDAALAAEVGWLAEHLRWDIEDDLARIVGNAPAHQLARMMRWVVEGARRLGAGSADLARGTAAGLDSLRHRASSSNSRSNDR
jgi:ubiquinone biosynthesis protein UbiJ